MKIVSIAKSKHKGTVKTCIQKAELIENHGIKNVPFIIGTGIVLCPKKVYLLRF